VTIGRSASQTAQGSKRVQPHEIPIPLARPGKGILQAVATLQGGTASHIIARYQLSAKLQRLSALKRRLLSGVVVLCLCSIVLLFVHLELRIPPHRHSGAGKADGDDSEDGDDGDGERDFISMEGPDERTARIKLGDEIRAVEFALTMLMSALHIAYIWLHHKVLVLVRGKRNAVSAAIEVLALWVGVMPPGVSGFFHISLTPEAEAGAFLCWGHDSPLPASRYCGSRGDIVSRRCTAGQRD